MSNAVKVRKAQTRSRPLFRILCLTFLVLAGLTIGGFLLPKSIDWPQAAATPSAVQRVLDNVVQATGPQNAPVVAVAPVVPPTPPIQPVRPARKLPDVAIPTTPPQLPEGKAYDLAKQIDEKINEALTKASTPTSPLADDAEFLRRAYLDLTGKIPSFEKVTSFLADSDPQKRAKLIDALLDSSDFGKHFAHLWADTLIKRDADTNRNLRPDAFIEWMAKQFNENHGWDKIVTEMITASGTVEDNPQTLFIVANQDNNQVSPAKLVAATSNLFMGLQLQCAECHVHPTVEKWKQDDFWGMAAFFGHTKFERDGQKAAKAPVQAVKEVGKQAEPRGKAAKQGEKAIPATDVISIPDPTDAKKTTGSAKARLFEVKSPANLGGAIPYRPKLAHWLTSPDNKYFARAAVNRLWAHVFAKGIINPVEDMGPNSSASHPELLDLLTKHFARDKFDIKNLLRAYCNTQAYNRTSRPTSENSSDEVLLSHMPIKVIGARELIDSIQLVAGSSSSNINRQQMRQQLKDAAANKGLRAPVTGVRFFDKREYEDAVTEFSFGIPQLLKQMNTQMTNGNGPVSRFNKSGRDRAEVIVDLYLAALARKPKPAELERLDKFAEQHGEKGLQDIWWSLLNSAEFVSNH